MEGPLKRTLRLIFLATGVPKMPEKLKLPTGAVGAPAR
jgi:hypothetical protein